MNASGDDPSRDRNEIYTSNQNALRCDSFRSLFESASLYLYGIPVIIVP